jgi:hypothetical protein
VFAGTPWATIAIAVVLPFSSTSAIPNVELLVGDLRVIRSIGQAIVVVAGLQVERVRAEVCPGVFPRLDDGLRVCWTGAVPVDLSPLAAVRGGLVADELPQAATSAATPLASIQ